MCSSEVEIPVPDDAQPEKVVKAIQSAGLRPGQQATVTIPGIVCLQDLTATTALHERLAHTRFCEIGELRDLTINHPEADDAPLPTAVFIDPMLELPHQRGCWDLVNVGVATNGIITLFPQPGTRLKKAALDSALLAFQCSEL